MKTIGKISALLLLIAVWTSCDGDYRQKARGSFGEVIVLMDSADHESNVADAINETYGQWEQTIPGNPPMFDLRFLDFYSNEQLEQIKRYKNILIVAPIDDESNVGEFIRALLSDEVEEEVRNGNSFSFPLEDQWYRDQWSMILTAPNDSALAEEIRNSETTLTNSLMEKELERWELEVYDRGEQFALEDSLWENHGWKIRIQHDWDKNLDTTYTDDNEEYNFLTMRRPLPENDRWFWAWWEEVDNASHVDEEWINAKRDTLMEKWIRGSRDSSYVTTARNRPHNTETIDLGDNLVVHETQGVWTMKEDAMAGPFANLTVYDEKTSRLFMLEFAQFAPKYDKRRFVRQFRAMLRTFESDSTWQEDDNNAVAKN